MRSLYNLHNENYLMMRPTYRIQNGTLYLNNHGSKWISIINGKKETISLQTKSGKTITRTPVYFYMFGNWGAALIHYKGKKVRVLMDAILED